MGYRLVIAALLISLAVFSGCSGSGSADGLQDAQSLHVPDGVDPQLWRELNERLEAELAARGTSAAKPLDDPTLRVSDFTLANHDTETGTLTFTWSYKLTGDYDLNGEVNASDLAPIAKYYDDTPASPDWDRAQFADGDGNDVVNSSDISTIAGNFGTIVHGVFLSIEFRDYDQNGNTNIADLTPIGQHALRPNPAAAFLGPLIGSGFSAPDRTSDEELPANYVGLYGFPMTATNRTLVDGRIHFSGEVGYVPTFSSTYYMAVPYRVVKVSPYKEYAIGLFSDQLLFVHPQ